MSVTKAISYHANSLDHSLVSAQYLLEDLLGVLAWRQLEVLSHK